VYVVAYRGSMDDFISAAAISNPENERDLGRELGALGKKLARGITLPRMSRSVDAFEGSELEIAPIFWETTEAVLSCLFVLEIIPSLSSADTTEGGSRENVIGTGPLEFSKSCSHFP